MGALGRGWPGVSRHIPEHTLYFLALFLVHSSSPSLPGPRKLTLYHGNTAYVQASARRRKLGRRGARRAHQGPKVGTHQSSSARQPGAVCRGYGARARDAGAWLQARTAGHDVQRRCRPRSARTGRRHRRREHGAQLCGANSPVSKFNLNVLSRFEPLPLASK